MTKSSSGEKLLSFSDDPMFRRVMRDEEIAKGVIGAILGATVDEVDYSNTEQEMAAGPYCRGIRLDAYVANSDAVYDIEMQAIRQASLGKRFRFYQSVIDSQALAPSEGFSELRKSLVAFICLYDPLKAGLPRYTFAPTCREKAACDLKSGMEWLVLNAKAWDKERRGELRALLEYVQKGRSASQFGTLPLLARIEGAVQEANSDEKWRSEMISKKAEEMAIREAALEEGIAKGETKGEAKGEAKGIAKGETLVHDRVAKLKVAMDEAGRREELFDALGDQAKTESLMREFGIQ